MFTLTAQDVREDLARCGDCALTPQQILPTSGSETLVQLARRCKDMESKRGVIDFHYMLTIIQLSYHCARYVEQFATYSIAYFQLVAVCLDGKT